jgi:pimeloyl-ACP methyl ester carboxylesterase
MIQPFRIAVEQAAIDDLKQRLAQARWPYEPQDAGWSQGTNGDYLRELVDYWQHSYDWRQHEAELNRYPQFLAEIEGLKIHFVHVRGKGPNPTPLILTHGWPGSFVELLPVVEFLTDPAAHGGNPALSFDVVIPSIPGYAFSDKPAKRGWTHADTARLWSKLMIDELGYSQFGAHGGDFGAIISQEIAKQRPDALIGMHLTYIGHYNTWAIDQSTLAPAEQAYMDAVQGWLMSEGAYLMVHSTKPQSVAYGLSDSPLGLAGWFAEKFQSWTDGGLEHKIGKDRFLTNLMIYWLTNSISSSLRSYSEGEMELMLPLPPVPTGFTIFPKDILPPPREWVERRVNLQHWATMPSGGHFAGLEEPELLANELRSFFGPFRH